MNPLTLSIIALFLSGGGASIFQRREQPKRGTPSKGPPRGSVTLLEDEIHEVTPAKRLPGEPLSLPSSTPSSTPSKRTATPATPAKGGASVSPSKAATAELDQDEAELAAKIADQSTVPASTPTSDAEKSIDQDEAELAAKIADQDTTPAPTVQPKAQPKPQPKAQPKPQPAAPVVVPEEQVPELPITPVQVCPDGYDPEKARRSAVATANHIRNRKYDYSRKLFKEWQTWAGITPDGIYGGGSAGALQYFGADAPRPLFKPTTIQPYEPPC